jgi:hypothetical protein
MGSRRLLSFFFSSSIPSRTPGSIYEERSRGPRLSLRRGGDADPPAGGACEDAVGRGMEPGAAPDPAWMSGILPFLCVMLA